MTEKDRMREKRREREKKGKTEKNRVNDRVTEGMGGKETELK